MARPHKIHDASSEPTSWPNFNAIPTDRYVDQRQTLLNAYQAVRAHSGDLTSGFSEAEQQLQSMPDASPAKWHLAHTTWFWETFLLQPFKPSFEWFDEHYCYLFNSYYNAIGTQYPRPRRGLIARPGLDGVWTYRRRIDEDVERLIEQCDDGVFTNLAPTLVLGLNHEQQHQELIRSDIKHGLFQSADAVAKARGSPDKGKRGHQSLGLGKNHPAGSGFSASPETGHFSPDANSQAPAAAEWLEVAGGVTEIGYAGDGFCFDNELARHGTLVAPFKIANRPVTAGEWLAFIEDGGYESPLLWLSDGWQWKQENEVEAPLYWRRFDGRWHRFALQCRNAPGKPSVIPEMRIALSGTHNPDPAFSAPAATVPGIAYPCRSGALAATNVGWAPVDRDEPVRHISYYEADAFAAWCGARLPREAEWEAAVDSGNELDGTGACWEWTQSAYSAYPGFKPTPGQAGEYNGKFMINQMVLRGASPATPALHSRPSYRNFFYPDARWQYSGLRLARDLP